MSTSSHEIIGRLAMPLCSVGDELAGEIGFKDLRLGVFSLCQKIACVHAWIKRNHGRIGRHPGDMVCNVHSPFDQLYIWVPLVPGTCQLPLLALRLRKKSAHKRDRVLPNKAQTQRCHDNGELAVYTMIKEDEILKPHYVAMDVFLAAFPSALSLLDE